MPNGGIIYAGRASGTIYAGRATPGLGGLGVGGPVGYAGGRFDAWPYPRGNGACAPVVPCCCKGPVQIAPGETQSIVLSWERWLNSVPGYQLNTVAEASLYDMTQSPPVPADDTVIKITSGIPGNDPTDNADAAGLVGLVPPFGSQVLIEAAKTAVIGAQYRLSICMIARDCDGRKIRQCDCVVIVIAEC